MKLPIEKDSSETLLDELYKLTVIEQERELTDREKCAYLALYEVLTSKGVSIPFGVVF